MEEKMNTKNRKVLTIVILLIFIISFLFSGCNLLQRRYEKVVTKNYTVSSSGKNILKIDNDNGNIKIVNNSKDSNIYVRADIKLHLTKRELKSENYENMASIKIDSSDNEIKITSYYTIEKDIIKFGRKSININYTIEVPRHLDLEVENINGDIVIRDNDGNIRISNINGDAELKSLTGKIFAELKNGKIKCELDSTKGINLSAVNGKVDFRIGENFTGNFDMQTVNGKIKRETVNFSSIVSDKKSFKGSIGSTDTKVLIETVNGNITITKRRDI
ncbi:MAG: DUF4097 domain-containing protein [Ignavibacteria bacterium]|nr:DUF4097 domain-containing protein [Ignavibacteria bacterium]